MKYYSSLLPILLLALIMLNAVAYDQPDCTDFRGTVLDLGESCGFRKTKTSYIMNGRDADLGEFPWLAHIYSRGPKGDKRVLPTCGGSIIHEQWVLSAAHCCDDQLAYVRLGEYDTRFKKDCQNGRCAPPHVNIAVDYYIKHEDYDSETYDSDICLIKLKKKIKFSEFIQPICLPIYCEIQTTDFESGRFTVAGWGALYEDDIEFASVLQKTELPIVSRDECEWIWSRTGGITEGQLCAGGEGRTDTCVGDSGGPLMYKAAVDGPTRYFQVGIVSFGSDCNRTSPVNFPGVYLGMAHYMSWILDNIEHYDDY